ncbi:hypothetical protein OIU74_018802 [Salix koriyanagi]|uniref:Uncharacterized protein n=1 Tax=Salix koriyanagi TaxID=2511006 RepID=A0A9Q1AIT9_9ROSI|nr:hypothetical protein OIU74_018802 [Salix koriyanagi]
MTIAIVALITDVASYTLSRELEQQTREREFSHSISCRSLSLVRSCFSLPPCAAASLSLQVSDLRWRLESMDTDLDERSSG